jgi:D-alanine-D-alanine ligase
MRKILVLRGGLASEHDVSIATGAAVLKSLHNNPNYQAIDGILPQQSQEVVGVLHQLIITHQPDFIFNALVGHFGEDGVVQGILDQYGIAYSHSSRETSMIAMNKDLCKQIVAQYGVPVIRGKKFYNGQLSVAEIGLPYPYIIKPCSDGSSRGLFKIHNIEEAKEAIGHFSDNTLLLAEEYIAGKEFSVGVLNGKPLPVLEIHMDFLTYHDKYHNQDRKISCPSESLTAVQQQQLQDYTLSIYQNLECKGSARADYRIKDNGDVYFLELNTQPAMTPTSFIPVMAKAAGISFDELIEALIK